MFNGQLCAENFSMAANLLARYCSTAYHVAGAVLVDGLHRGYAV